MARSRRRVSATTLLALTAGYLAAGKLSLSFALLHASASPVWPPTGIALAAFLLLGRSVWPAILAGAFLVNITTEGNAATSLGIALGNTLEGLAGALLVSRFAGGTAVFERPKDVFKFVALAGLCATAISPSIGLTSLCLGGFASWSHYWPIWLTWWLGDVGGAVIVTPVIVLWAQRPRPGWTRAQWLEAAGVLATIAGVGAITFGGVFPAGGGPSLSFPRLPPVIWTAFRFGRRETAAAALLLSAIAVWGTELGPQPSPEQVNASLVMLQLVMGVISVTALSLAAVVSERRRAHKEISRQAAELARSNAELDEFARVVSHDLKAPLRGITSLAEWVVADCKDVLDPESRANLLLLGERARRMTQLIDGVLRYSRLGRTRLVPEQVDSKAVVEEVIDSLGPLRGVSVRIEGRLPTVRCDRTGLCQVFQNLIQNGVEHLGRPFGEIVVSCREAGEEFEFSVRDDGVGIPEAHLRRIFEMFHVVNRQGGTTGVGLTIARKIVESHGGSILAASRPGHGATFRFTIPR